MNITFLVGNGFDIASGLKSSYADFYKWYCKRGESDNACVNTFRRIIDEDIKNGKKNWADFEEALGQYTKEFSKDTVDDFFACYEDARENLMVYLEEQSEQFDDNLNTDTIGKLKNGIRDFYQELTPKERRPFDALFATAQGGNSTIHFISYNYTNVLDRCIEKISAEPLKVWNNSNGKKCTYTITLPVLHIHGRMEQYPIFGVNDESQIANKELLEIPEFCKLMIKPRCVDAVGELWHEEAEKRINESKIICIYGMSLGITDTIWFNRIMEWLRKDEERQLIVFWHSNDPSNRRSPYKRIMHEQVAQKRMTDFSSVSDSQLELLNQRIHIVENTEKVLRIRL